MMTEMGQVFAKWDQGNREVDKWRWGLWLSRYRKADRRSVLTEAITDVLIYEKQAHGDSRLDNDKFNKIIDCILGCATYVCSRDGKPILDV